jgi:uncharacterized membrane protein YbhN (UPF0104 family)
MKNIRRYLGYALTLIILAFLAQTVYSSWSQVAASGFTFAFNAPLVALALVLLIVGRMGAVEAWRTVLAALGARVGFRVAYRLWIYSNLARYIPGNIWQVAAMAVLAEEHGVSKTNVVLSQAIYTSIALAICGLFGLTLLPLGANYLILVLIIFVATIILFALPPVFRLVVYLAARVMKKEPHDPSLTFWRGLTPSLYSALMWTINGIALFCFLAAITNQVTIANLPALIAMNSAAYWLGYVSFITPSGLGIREGALALMLATIFPAPVAAALALIVRLWSTAAELLSVPLAYALNKYASTQGYRYTSTQVHRDTSTQVDK